LSLFITFEGGEGCGKSTQAKALHRRLRRQGYQAHLVEEPGGTSLGRTLRSFVKWPRGLPLKMRDKVLEATVGEQLFLLPMVPEAELFLFAASRAQLLVEIIQPQLAQGHTVVCDRYAFSSLAYQGYGRGLDLKLIESINQLATRGIWPQLVILLDIDPVIGLARSKRKNEVSRFEEEDLDFHKRVRDGYLKLAAKEPERWLVIDGTLPKAKIGKIIWEKVSQLLSSKGYL